MESNDLKEPNKGKGEISTSEDPAIDKEKNIAKRKNIALSVVALLIMIGIGIWYYFYWDSVHYFSTDNAKVTAQMYSIVPTMSGKLVKYTIDQGSIVRENQIIGRIENGPYIKSPINGIIVKNNVTLNQIVSPASVVAIVADTNDVYIGANIEETDIIKIKVGQAATVELDAYPGKNFKAHVAEVDHSTQNAISGNATSFSTSGTYTKITQLIPIKIKFDDNTDLKNLIGTNSYIKIRIK